MSDTTPANDERAALVESKINLERASGIEISAFGMSATDLSQIFEFAKGMALAGPMVPAFCRNRPWACAAIILQAIEWRMSPFSVARQAYEVENKRTGETTVAYMSQLQHAVLESRAPLKERLRVRYEGEGDDRVCIVSGTFKGETEAREWRSPPLGERRPKPQKRQGRNGEEYETTSGSPLWFTKPDVQAFFDTSRDWARIYCPDVILGIYSHDEMSEAGFIDATPNPTPEDDGGLGRRLSESALARAGFSVDHALAALDPGKPAGEIKGGPSEAREFTPNLPDAAVADVPGGTGPDDNVPVPPSSAEGVEAAPASPPAADESPSPADSRESEKPGPRAARRPRRAVPPQSDEAGLL